MKKLPACLLLLLFVGHAPFALCNSYQPGEMLRRDGSTLHYVLKPADTVGSTGDLLVILQGSSCRSVATITSIWEKYALLLPNADALAIEKYGIPPGFHGESAGECPQAYLQKDTLEQRYQDLVDVIQKLQRQHEYQRVVLIGGSEGASLAILAAAKGAPVDAAIAVNAGGRWFVDDVLHAMRASIPDETAREEAVAGFKQFISSLDAQALDGPAVSDHGIGWWRAMTGNDQQQNLAQATLPIHLIQGGMDTDVSPQAWLLMRDAIGETSNPLVSFTFYPGLDHRLRAEDGDDKTGEVLHAARDWLRRLGAGP